jgi:hypothetical protein
MIEGGVLLIRIKDYETNKLDLIQSTLLGKADSISVRKSNLNDVFLWLSSNDHGLK